MSLSISTAGTVFVSKEVVSMPGGGDMLELELKVELELELLTPLIDKNGPSSMLKLGREKARALDGRA